MLSHFSISSSWEYRMGVVRLTSRRDRRALGAALVAVWTCFFGSSSLVVEDVGMDGRVESRNCWMSLRERERPVPSYPFIVDARKTR